MFDQCAWPDTWGGGGGGGQDRARGNHLTAECEYGGCLCGGVLSTFGRFNQWGCCPLLADSISGGAVHFWPIQPMCVGGGGRVLSTSTFGQFNHCGGGGGGAVHFWLIQPGGGGGGGGAVHFWLIQPGGGGGGGVCACS